MKPTITADPLRRIRLLILIFIVGLLISGATAIPLETEHTLLAHVETADSNTGTEQSSVKKWIITVREGIVETNAKYPFIAYGTDWLAFAHFVIAIAFIGPLRDPIKNVWIIEFGIIACILVMPFALIMGNIRGIPFGWRLIDCSFGVLGLIPLIICRCQISRFTNRQKI
jgi:hypothetical protein